MDKPNGNIIPPEKNGTTVGLPQFGLAEEVLGTDRTAGARNGSPEPERADRDGDTAKYVTFFLGAEEYGLPIGQVQEINRVAEITRVPNAREHVMGVVNLRGRILPVIELKSRLGLGHTEPTKESRIVVVECGAKVLGLMVDRVAQVLNISPGQIEQAPEEVVQVDSNYLSGMGKIEDRMIILLELQKIIEGKAL